MSTPGRPEGEYRSAQHEGTPTAGSRRRIALRVALVLLAMLVVAAATLGTLWVLVAPEHLPTIVVNGRELVLGAADGGHWLAATLAALVALLVLMVIVPMALLLAIALPLLLVVIGLAVGALAIALIVGLTLSPLLLVGWLLWRATRGPRDGEATITR
jgi:hypothetical protein